MPDRSDGVCQTTPATPTPPDHVRSVPRTTTQVCPHRRIPTVTDGDGPAHPWLMAQSIDRSIWRMLGLVSCHDAAPARRYPSRAMGALVCGLPYHFPCSEPVKITRRRRQIPGLARSQSMYPSRFARGAACGPSFMCAPVVAMV